MSFSPVRPVRVRLCCRALYIALTFARRRKPEYSPATWWHPFDLWHRYGVWEFKVPWQVQIRVLRLTCICHESSACQMLSSCPALILQCHPVTWLLPVPLHCPAVQTGLPGHSHLSCPALAARQSWGRKQRFEVCLSARRLCSHVVKAWNGTTCHTHERSLPLCPFACERPPPMPRPLLPSLHAVYQASSNDDFSNFSLIIAAGHSCGRLQPPVCESALVCLWPTSRHPVGGCC